MMYKIRMILVALLARLLKPYCILYTVGALEPYYDYQHSRWCFDDKLHGLKAEGFSEGIGRIIDGLTKDFFNPKQGGWQLLFSSIPFPGYHISLIKGDEGVDGGVWYYCPDMWIDGWLCEQLYKYFPVAPETIYIRAQQKGKV